jgi:hypothetical protein
MESQSGWDPEKDEPGEVRQPQIKLGVQAKGSSSKVESADYITVRQEDIGELERIEASLGL